ncbi:hypothetical protein T484DRAFT_1635211, partial [Baffinella frigidus]
NPEPRTPNLEPHTLNPKPKTLNPKPKTRNPKPKTQTPKPKTQNPNPTPDTPNPKPKTQNPTAGGPASGDSRTARRALPNQGARLLWAHMFVRGTRCTPHVHSVFVPTMRYIIHVHDTMLHVQPG